jgi:hypothetical protein
MALLLFSELMAHNDPPRCSVPHFAGHPIAIGPINRLPTAAVHRVRADLSAHIEGTQPPPARSPVASSRNEMTPEHRSRQRAAYLEPASTLAMLLYSVLLLAALVFFLAYMPPLLRESADKSATTIEVPAELTKEDTLGYR